MKTCNKCKNSKDEKEFTDKRGKLLVRCNDCRETARIYREKNKEKIAEYNKNYYQDNKEIIAKRDKVYYKNRYNNDPLFSQTKKDSKRINSYLKNIQANKYKASKKLPFITSTYGEFKTYIENQFTSNMSWDNYGEYWSIDHIIPQNLAETVDELKTLHHYSNLQPIEKSENSRKQDIINEDIKKVNKKFISEDILKRI